MKLATAETAMDQTWHFLYIHSLIIIWITCWNKCDISPIYTFIYDKMLEKLGKFHFCIWNNVYEISVTFRPSHETESYPSSISDTTGTSWASGNATSYLTTFGWKRPSVDTFPTPHPLQALGPKALLQLGGPQGSSVKLWWRTMSWCRSHNWQAQKHRQTRPILLPPSLIWEVIKLD